MPLALNTLYIINDKKIFLNTKYFTIGTNIKLFLKLLVTYFDFGVFFVRWVEIV